MNKYLLLEAIRQSNMHPTTKSFLTSVLKGIEEDLENNPYSLYEGPTGMLPTTGEDVQGKTAVDRVYIPTDEELNNVFGTAGSQPMPKQVEPFNPNAQTPAEKQAWLEELLGPRPRR